MQVATATVYYFITIYQVPSLRYLHWYISSVLPIDYSMTLQSMGNADTVIRTDNACSRNSMRCDFVAYSKLVTCQCHGEIITNFATVTVM